MRKYMATRDRVEASRCERWLGTVNLPDAQGAVQHKYSYLTDAIM